MMMKTLVALALLCLSAPLLAQEHGHLTTGRVHAQTVHDHTPHVRDRGAHAHRS
ncbi:MAG: hypothetical protein KGK08_11545 [Acidobacteriota bacterium]|nr:hypothetical protein [Acidobacteriota bacterium]